MRELEEVANCLLDSDETTRDITFTPVAAERIRAFVNSLLQAYETVMARDADSNDITSLFKNELQSDSLCTPAGYIHAVLKGSKQLIPALQVFIDWPMDRKGYGLELSFFPEDIDASSFQIDAFLSLVAQWNVVLGADDYFVRYENASWDWYDANGLGVIYTGSQLHADGSN